MFTRNGDYLNIANTERVLQRYCVEIYLGNSSVFILREGVVKDLQYGL